MTNKRSGVKTARVIAQYRGKYRVKSDEGEYWAEVTGKHIYAASSQLDYPVVNDFVNIIELGHGQAVINEILPRKNVLTRKAAGKDAVQPIAANVDTAFIVQAVDRDFNLNRFERYLTIVMAAKINPAFLLNKIDLISAQELAEKIAQIKDRFHDIKIITTSAAQENGIGALRKELQKGKVYCFVGSSGVGKSSLINNLLGKELLKTRLISAATKKGRHATTHRELFVLENGAMVIDNPGIREVGLADSGGAVENVFDEISDLAKGCKFDNCTHIHEPGCAVLAALDSGKLSKEKYENYIKLKKETDHYAMSSLEKKQRDRSFNRIVKSFKKFKKLNR
jgi:ribosome biogenesis GTPase